MVLYSLGFLFGEKIVHERRAIEGSLFLEHADQDSVFMGRLFLRVRIFG